MDAEIGILDDSVQFLISSLTENIPVVGKLIGKEANKGVDSLFKMLSGSEPSGGESKIALSLYNIQTSLDSIHQDLSLLKTQISEIRDNEYYKPLDDFLRNAEADINERSQALIQVLNEKTDDAYQAFAEGLNAQDANRDALEFINKTIQFAKIIDGNAGGGRSTTTPFCVFSAHVLKKCLWEHECYDTCKKYEYFLFGLFGSAAAVSCAYSKYFLGTNLNNFTASRFQTAYTILQKEITDNMKKYIERVITPFYESNPNIKRMIVNDDNLYDSIPFAVGELSDPAGSVAFDALKSDMLRVMPYISKPTEAVKTKADGWHVGECFNRCFPIFSEFNTTAIATIKKKAPGKSLGAIFEAAGCPVTRVPNQYIIVRDISFHEAVRVTWFFLDPSCPFPADIFYGFILDPWDDTLTYKTVPIYADLLIPDQNEARQRFWFLSPGLAAIMARLNNSTFSIIRRANAPKPTNEIWDYASSLK